MPSPVIRLFLLAVVTAGGYFLGRQAGRRSRRAALLAMLLAWEGMLVAVLLPTRPDYEHWFITLSLYEGLRGGWHLPFAALLGGAVLRYLPRGRRGVVHAGLFVLLAVTGYAFFRDALPPSQSGPYRRAGPWAVAINTRTDTRRAALAATLLGYYGVEVSEEWAVEASRARPGRDAEMVGVCRALRLGLAGTECRVTVERQGGAEFNSTPLPCLVELICAEGGRDLFLCLAVGGEGIWIAAPDLPAQQIPEEEFFARWTGYAIVIQHPAYLQPKAYRQQIEI